MKIVGNSPNEGNLLRTMKVLIVDDEPLNVTLLTEVLREEGFSDLQGITDSRMVQDVYHAFGPDLVLLDLMMPYKDGFQVMAELLEAQGDDEFLPILVLTADSNVETRRRALASGATDFLTKPFDHVEVRLRIDNLLRSRWQHLRLHSQNLELDEKVRQRTSELEKAQQIVVASMQQLEEAQSEILGRLAQAAEYRDDDTGQHTYRVGHMAGALARTMGLDSAEVDLIERAAPLHDVGKIGISDTILLKPGRLTPEEFEIIKLHTVIGSRLLAGGHSDLVKMAESIAQHHHERWDGTGYPNGLKGHDIPLAAQIVSCADVFDALTHERPYKRAWTVEDAMQEIKAQAGRQFNPDVVCAFEHLQPVAGE